MINYRVALVTGASSGIGKEVCELFAQKGISLIISGRNLSELEHLHEKLCRKVNVQTVQADLGTSGGRQLLIDVLHRQVPDLVINNAGFGIYGDALDCPMEKQASILEVNGRAVLELTLEAARAMIHAKKKGVVLNISSAAAFQILPCMAVYAASKAFVSQFSQALDFEVKHQGVRILTLCPGRVDTDFQVRAGGKLDKSKPDYMTAPFVAGQIWDQTQKLDPLRIIDWKYRILTFLSHLIPKSWIAAIVKKNIQKVKNDSE